MYTNHLSHEEIVKIMEPLITKELLKVFEDSDLVSLIKTGESVLVQNVDMSYRFCPSFKIEVRKDIKDVMDENKALKEKLAEIKQSLYDK